MTFLKKLGQALLQGVAVVTGIWPIVQPLFGSHTAAAQTAGTVVNDFTQIAGIVAQVEAVIQTPGSGAAKLSAAIPLVTNIVKTSELVAGKKIANETLFVQACSEITQGMVDLLNSLHPDNVQTSGTAATVVSVTPAQG